MRLVALLLLASCAHVTTPPVPPWCVTKCGLRLVPSDVKYRPSCEDLQSVEDDALKVFARAVHIDSRFYSACSRLGMYTLEIGPPVLMHPYTREPVTGVTRCERARMYIGHRTKLANSALAHEMAHAVQACEPLPPINITDPDHSNWDKLYRLGVE